MPATRRGYTRGPLLLWVGAGRRQVCSCTARLANPGGGADPRRGRIGDQGGLWPHLPVLTGASAGASLSGAALARQVGISERHGRRLLAELRAEDEGSTRRNGDGAARYEQGGPMHR